VWVFKRKGSTWKQQAPPLKCDACEDFARSVALSGNGKTALVSLRLPRPSITSFSPNNGPEAGGTAVTITGTHLSGATEVEFGRLKASYTINSDTSIAAISPPAGAGMKEVTVFTHAGESCCAKYAYWPVVTSISPSSGPRAGGTEVNISGFGLSGATAVRFYCNSEMGSNAASFTSHSSALITAVTPPYVGGNTAARVTVTTPEGTSRFEENEFFGENDVFRYQPASPISEPCRSGP
jgi:hypothetical protein